MPIGTYLNQHHLFYRWHLATAELPSHFLICTKAFEISIDNPDVISYNIHVMYVDVRKQAIGSDLHES